MLSMLPTIPTHCGKKNQKVQIITTYTVEKFHMNTLNPLTKNSVNSKVEITAVEHINDVNVKYVINDSRDNIHAKVKITVKETSKIMLTSK